MGDTSTLYVLELFELYRHTGNLSFVKVNWKSATNALSCESTCFIREALGGKDGRCLERGSTLRGCVEQYLRGTALL